MRYVIPLATAVLVGCQTIDYGEVADYRLYEADDPDGYEMLVECLGPHPFNRKISRDDAQAVRRLSDRINAGEPLSAGDFEGVPCLN